MLLVILAGLTQFLLAGFGVVVSLKPPKREHHWRWIGFFVVIGLAGVAFTSIAGHDADKALRTIQDDLKEANETIARFGSKLDEIIKQPPSEKQRQRAVTLKEDLSRSQSHKDTIDPKQAVYGQAMDLSDRIGVIGENFDNEITDVLHESETRSVGPQGFKTRTDQARKKWIELYEQKYRDPALSTRRELLKYVPDVPVFEHLGNGEGEYRFPTNSMGIEAVSKNLRALAVEFARKYSLKIKQR